MERMTKREADGTAIALEYEDETYLMQDDDDAFTGYISSPIIDRLAELEDMLESGELLKLPCIEPFNTCNIETGEPCICYNILYRHTDGELVIDCAVDKEEAEAKLKKLQESVK